MNEVEIKVLRRLEKSLKFLNDQPDIAAYFEAEGITGIPGRAGHCPVANYLKREGRQAAVTVTYQTASAMDFAAAVPYLVRTEVPKGVIGFMNDFDHRRHPHLIKESK